MFVLKRTRLVVGLVFVIASLAIGSRVVANAINPPCTVADVLAYQDIQAGVSAQVTVAGKPLDDLALRYPGARVVEQSVMDLRSASIPPVDGHRALIVLLAVMADVPIGGPIGHPTTLAPVACGIAIYDADTGEFIVSMSRLGK